MKKTYSFRLFLTMLFVAVFGMVSAETVVTFDFENNGATYGGTDAGAETTGFSQDGVSVTVGKGTGTTQSKMYSNGFRFYKSNTMTVSASGNITKIEFTALANAISNKYYTADNLTYNGAALTTTSHAATATWTGSSTSVTFGNSNQVRLLKMVVTIDGEGGGGVTPDPGPGGDDPVVTTEETIASLNAATSEGKANVSLKLTSAQVVYIADNSKGGKDVYVREGSKAIMFFGTAQNFQLNSYLTGDIIVDYAPYYGVPEVKDNTSTNMDGITVTTGSNAAATVATIDELLALNHLCDYIVVKGVTITVETANNKTNYYANKDDKKVQLFKGIDVSSYAGDGNTHDVYAVFNNIYKGAPEIAPISVDEEPNGGAGGGGDDPVVTTEETIATLNALTANKANVTVKLTNAQVVYSAANTSKNNKGGNDIYVREGDKAIMFFDSKLALNVGEVLNGTIDADFSYYYGIPELKDNASSNLDKVTATPGTAVVPTEATVAEVLELKHVADLVILRNVTITAEGTNYYANQDGKKVQLYKGIDVSGYANGQNYNVTAVFNNIYKGVAEIAPIAVQEGVYIVPAPVITPNGGTFNGPVEVTISGNGMIFYTTDGSDPDFDSDEYTAPFTVSENTVVKAIAYDNEFEASEIVTAQFTITQSSASGYPLPFDEEFDNGAGSFSLQEGEVAIWSTTEYKGDKGMRASGHINNANVESEAWLISPAIDLTNVQGATMTVKDEVSKHFSNADEEATVWVREVSATAAGDWVQLPFSHPAVEGTNTYSAVTPVQVSLNDFAGKSVQVGFKYTSTSSSAGTWVIFGVSVADNGGSIVMTAPTFTPAAGTYDDDVEVTIEAADDMVIRYTLDGTDPTIDSQLYEEPFVITETTTVKAIAVNPTDGAISPVASATYTIDRKVAGDVVNIDFVNNPWNMSPSYTAAEGASEEEKQAANDQGNFTAPVVWNGVTLTFDASNSSSKGKPRLFTGSNGETTLRLYKDQTMKFDAPAGQAIGQIIFYAKVASNIALNDGEGKQISAPAMKFRAPAEEISKVSKKWTPTTPVLSETFTATASNQLTEVEVVLVDATGIQNVQVENESANRAVFDLQGRRVQQASKGLYIINGKKVLVK